MRRSRPPRRGKKNGLTWTTCTTPPPPPKPRIARKPSVRAFGAIRGSPGGSLRGRLALGLVLLDGLAVDLLELVRRVLQVEALGVAARLAAHRGPGLDALGDGVRGALDVAGLEQVAGLAAAHVVGQPALAHGGGGQAARPRRGGRGALHGPAPERAAGQGVAPVAAPPAPAGSTVPRAARRLLDGGHALRLE